MVGCTAFLIKVEFKPKKGKNRAGHVTQKEGDSSFLYGEHLDQEGDRRELGGQSPSARSLTCGVELHLGLKGVGHPCTYGALIM